MYTHMMNPELGVSSLYPIMFGLISDFDLETLLPPTLNLIKLLTTENGIKLSLTQPCQEIIQLYSHDKRKFADSYLIDGKEKSYFDTLIAYVERGFWIIYYYHKQLKLAKCLNLSNLVATINYLFLKGLKVYRDKMSDTAIGRQINEMYNSIKDRVILASVNGKLGAVDPAVLYLLLNL